MPRQCILPEDAITLAISASSAYAADDADDLRVSTSTSLAAAIPVADEAAMASRRLR